MSDKSLVVNTQSWHARRFRESVGSTKRTNLCHYFWVVMKSLAVGLVPTTTVKVAGRTMLNWVVATFMVLAGSVLVIGVALALLTILGTWVLALIVSATGSEITPQNTIPFLALLRGDNPVNPLTHSDALFFVHTSIAIDFLIVLGLSVWGVTKYNATHTAGFIRLSWERLKIWKDGTIVCPIIEFEEPQ